MPKINATKAARIFYAHGVDLAYPTVVKRLKQWGLHEQPTGPGGEIVIDEEKLRQALEEHYPKGASSAR